MFRPEILASTRVVLVGPADEKDVDNNVNGDDDGGGNQVFLVVGVVLESIADAQTKGVEHDPQGELTGAQEEGKRQDPSPDLAADARS